MQNRFYVYAHYRNDTNTVFYIGKGQGRRAYEKKSRNTHWHNIGKKHGYTVKMWAENLSEADAFRIEMDWILLYGRKSNNTGNLVNASTGGEGNSGMVHSEATRQRLSEIQVGVKKGPKSQEHKDKLRDALIGKSHNSERVANIQNGKRLSVAKKGRTLGVVRKLDKWVATYRDSFLKKYTYIGTFATEADAIMAQAKFILDRETEAS